MTTFMCDSWKKQMYLAACDDIDPPYPVTVIDELRPVDTQPPKFGRKGGRPKMKKHACQRATQELENQVKKSKRSYTCSVCKQPGHNRAGCPGKED